MSYAPVPPQPQPPRTPMSRRKRWTLVAVSAVAAGVGGSVVVSGFMPDSGSRRDTSAPERVSQPQVVTTTAATARAEFTANELAYWQALAAIDPDLVPTSGRAAISAAENTCGDILQGTPNEVLISRVISRTKRTDADVDKARAEEILKLMKQWICPDWTAEWTSKHPSTSS